MQLGPQARRRIRDATQGQVSGDLHKIAGILGAELRFGDRQRTHDGLYLPQGNRRNGFSTAFVRTPVIGWM